MDRSWIKVGSSQENRKYKTDHKKQTAEIFEIYEERRLAEIITCRAYWMKTEVEKSNMSN